MIPLHGYHCPGDSAYDSSYQLSKVVNDAFDPESFIMIVLNHQVQCISQSQRQQAKCGVIPALNPIWEKLFRQMTLSVSNLNRYMALAQSMYFVLQRVADLMYIEVQGTRQLYCIRSEHIANRPNSWPWQFRHGARTLKATAPWSKATAAYHTCSS